MKKLGNYQPFQVYEDIDELKGFLIKDLKVCTKEEFTEKIRSSLNEKNKKIKIVFSTEFPSGREMFTGDTFTENDLSSLDAFMCKLHTAKTTYKSKLGNIGICLAELAHDAGLVKLNYPVLRTDWEERSEKFNIIFDSDFRRLVDYYTHLEIVPILLKELND